MFKWLKSATIMISCKLPFKWGIRASILVTFAGLLFLQKHGRCAGAFHTKAVSNLYSTLLKGNSRRDLKLNKSPAQSGTNSRNVTGPDIKCSTISTVSTVGTHILKFSTKASTWNNFRFTLLRFHFAPYNVRECPPSQTGILPLFQGSSCFAFWFRSKQLWPNFQEKHCR